MNTNFDEKELSEAIENAKDSQSVFSYKLKKPVEYNGNRIESLSFDFEKLTGKDAQDIENEVLSIYGKNVVVPALSPEYLKIMSAKACKDGIGSDIFDMLFLKDYNGILGKARSFLLQSES